MGEANKLPFKPVFNSYGELINVLAPALSCTTRQKSHYRGKEPSKRYPPGNSFLANDVTLQLAAIAYNLMHAARLMLSQTRGPQMSLKRLREQVLHAPARLLSPPIVLNADARGETYSTGFFFVRRWARPRRIW